MLAPVARFNAFIFFNVRDAYFQRGINRAVERGWINRMRDRYKYELTKSGLVEASIESPE